VGLHCQLEPVRSGVFFKNVDFFEHCDRHLDPCVVSWKYFSNKVGTFLLSTVDVGMRKYDTAFPKLVRVRSGRQEVHYVGRPRKRWETCSHEDGTSLLPILISPYLLFIVRYEQRKYKFLCSEGFQALPICPSKSNMSMEMSMEQWWNDAVRRKLKYWEENL